MHIDDWNHYLSNDLSINRSSLYNNEAYYDLAAYSTAKNDKLACTYLENLALIKLSGVDAQAFLQGQLSCDMGNINQQVSGIGTHNDVKGRMLSSFRVIQQSKDTFLLVIHHSIVESCIAQLKKYAVFSNVEISYDDSRICFGLIGQWSQTLALTNTGYLAQHEHTFGTIIQVDNVNARFLLITDITNSQNTFEKLTSIACLKNIPIWILADINAGIVWIEKESSDEHIAQTFNYHLQGGISFTKGCYIGQEIIIRAQHRGTLKRHLFFIKLDYDKPLAINSKILLAGKTVGYLVSNILNENAELCGLAVLKNNIQEHACETLTINAQNISVLTLKSLQENTKNN